MKLMSQRENIACWWTGDYLCVLAEETKGSFRFTLYSAGFWMTYTRMDQNKVEKNWTTDRQDIASGN